MRPDGTPRDGLQRSPVSARGRRHQHGAVGIVLSLAAAAACGDDARTLARVQHELRTLTAALARDDAALDQARDAADALARELAAAQSAQDALERRISVRQARVDSLIARQSALASRAATAQARLDQHAYAHFALLRQPRLKLLLDVDDSRRRARHLAYFDYLQAKQTARAGAAAEELAALAATRSALKLETDTLRRLRQDTRTALAELTAKRAARTALVAAIEQRLADGKVRADALTRDEQRLRELLGELAPVPNSAPTTTSFATLQGRLAWPAEGTVANVAGGSIRAGGARWAGVLIETDRDAEVRAVAAGQVVFADWFRHLGQLIVLDHGDGFLTLYGNNGELTRKPGDAIAAGEVIARVGDGAGELPRGVYFELRADGEPLDPRRWCQPR